MNARLVETDFIKIDEAPVPAGASVFYYNTVDGAKLRMAYFPCPSSVEKPRGTVVLLSGRCEFIEKYFEVVKDLHARGFAVASMDWRGQGLSSRMLPEQEKGHIKTFGTYTADLKLFMQEFVMPRCPKPYIAMSHSMGGMPLMSLLAESYRGFKAAFMVAPMTRLFERPTKRLWVGWLAKLASHFGMSKKSIAGVREHSMKFKGNNLTSDQRRHRMFQALLEAAPNAAVHAPTYGWVNAASQITTRLARQGALSGVGVPVKIVTAGQDSTVDGTHGAILAAQYERISAVKIDGALHEILMEADIYRDQLLAEFDRFVDPLLSEKEGPKAT